jgi:hypothetical protein
MPVAEVLPRRRPHHRSRGLRSPLEERRARQRLAPRSRPDYENVGIVITARSARLREASTAAPVGFCPRGVAMTARAPRRRAASRMSGSIPHWSTATGSTTSPSACTRSAMRGQLGSVDDDPVSEPLPRRRLPRPPPLGLPRSGRLGCLFGNQFLAARLRAGRFRCMAVATTGISTALLQHGSMPECCSTPSSRATLISRSTSSHRRGWLRRP